LPGDTNSVAFKESGTHAESHYKFVKFASTNQTDPKFFVDICTALIENTKDIKDTKKVDNNIRFALRILSNLAEIEANNHFNLRYGLKHLANI